MPRDSIGFSQTSLKRLVLTELKELEKQLSLSLNKLLASQQSLELAVKLDQSTFVVSNPDKLSLTNEKLNNLRAKQEKTKVGLTQRLKAVRLEILIKGFDKELECEPTEIADKERDHLQTEMIPKI
ncbi:hypothetical protein Psal006b_00058 [Piscirickettsia salmonis]|uniref:Glycoside hydrolase n=1 Tax=Piscirickettsia salmonis TaxID=1238 RepID=A0AAC9EVF1_PISSA|nr:hypothetical protein [Piscirickettsia salmonis]ALB24284.1 glycoside hydrolase [Piscirickettsia salmonis]ALT18744.1 hypothetical protein PSLF89_07975 [Piscirickettsia salmonis LF-89 = ATCC VR-1361]ALY04081.1 hypothetical protein AWE47_15430 [Piscirickettsia salmonis]AMA43636.1 hypothetical protein AWJ11_15600 [Piscirickettsia salmonis]APS60802.1 hypothetical protein AVI53_09675 [Piscirickettsia salmonis]